jgi:Polyketide cyclase / dehydrase and lipid transport
MPHGQVIDVIPAPAAEVFDLLHNYDRRMEWDTLLRAAYLLDGHRQAGLGVRSVCAGKWTLGGISLTTEYISFRAPEVAAVQMINRPAFFETFAATIRHAPRPDGSSTIEYNYNFTGRPRWLRFILHPIMNFCFKLETRKRLAALRRHFARENCSKAVAHV